ncbi:MAG: hypothetical protein H6741_34465 [Alphaproteobacteria bacterium]|nr:hypothetical protein [Alphaproteobacteria bacterium]
MLLLLLACAPAPVLPLAPALPLSEGPGLPSAPAPDAPEEVEPAEALSVEILDLGLSMHGGDGDNMPLTVTWVASAELTVREGPLRVEELRWVVEAEDLRFVARSVGDEAPIPAGAPPLRLEAARPLSLESFKVLRDHPADVTLTVLAKDAQGQAAQATTSQRLTHPLR